MSKALKLDFTNVESFQRPSEGEHVAKIASAELKQSSGGNDMIVCAFEVTKGQDKGARAYENFPLAENALWKLKGMLQSIGLKCEGKVQLDLDKLIGKVCIIDVYDDEYNGQIRAKISGFKKLSAVADEEPEDDEDEEDEAPAPKKSKKKEEKKPSKKAPMNPPEDEDEDDDWDDEEDEDEEEEEKPAPKKKSEKKATSKKAAKKSEPEEDEDDDDDWDE